MNLLYTRFCLKFLGIFVIYVLIKGAKLQITVYSIFVEMDKQILKVVIPINLKKR